MENLNSIWIKQLLSDDICQNRENIIRYIFESNTNCSFMNEYSLEDAKKKWTELYNYSLMDKAIVYGAFKTHNEEVLMVGFVWAYEYPFRDDTNRLYVSILHVQREYRSVGVGAQLMQKIEEEALVKGCHSVYLHVEGCNDGGIRFYNKNGYESERIQLVKKLV